MAYCTLDFYDQSSSDLTPYIGPTSSTSSYSTFWFEDLHYNDCHMFFAGEPTFISFTRTSYAGAPCDIAWTSSPASETFTDAYRDDTLSIQDFGHEPYPGTNTDMTLIFWIVTGS
jgi:hypothetical protein